MKGSAKVAPLDINLALQNEGSKLTSELHENRDHENDEVIYFHSTRNDKCLEFGVDLDSKANSFGLQKLSEIKSPNQLILSFSGIFRKVSDEFVFGTSSDAIGSKCHQVQVRFRASDQSETKGSLVEFIIYLKNAAGQTIATGCKWSQPFLPHEWIEVETVFDDEDEIVRLSGPGCRYEVWYKMGKRDDKGTHMLCVDYFSLLGSNDFPSKTIESVHEAIYDCPVCKMYSSFNFILFY
jgi:hypothetical protein